MFWHATATEGVGAMPPFIDFLGGGGASAPPAPPPVPPPMLAHYSKVRLFWTSLFANATFSIRHYVSSG